MLWEQPATITRSLLPTGPTAANLPQRHAVARRDRHTQTDKRPYYVDSANKHLLYLTHTHTHTQPFNGPFSGTTWVSRYQKGNTNLDFTEARDSEWQWHQLGYMQVCTSLQTDNHASTPPLSFFTGQMPFLPPNQQRQSTEGNLPYLTATKLPTSVYHNASVEA